MTTVEEDFWKDVFVHMQHKNMMRSNGERLTLENCEKEFNRFETAYPQVQPVFTDGGSYKIFEFTIRTNLKMRLFIQNQIKASIMEKQGNDFIKICDAKFTNNPFPEIYEFVKNLDSYAVQIERSNVENQKQKAQQRIALQFIKAYITLKTEKSGFIWSLEPEDSGFSLKLEKSGQSGQAVKNAKSGSGAKSVQNEKKGDAAVGHISKVFHISTENFKSEIDSIL